MPEPVFAVVGHVNKGKSSIVATLAEDDSVAIAHEARTTLDCREFALKVDGQVLFTLIDTPGFEQARHALAWMQARESDAASRSEVVAAFVREHAAAGRFPEECKLLAPILAGAGILYVVDGSRPFSPEYEAEMEILRWTGRPRMAVINEIGRRNHRAEWQAALDQYFSLVRVFNAHQADYRRRLQLLTAFRELREEWRPVIDRSIANMRRERERRRRYSAFAIADMLARQLSLTLEQRIPEDARLEKYRADLDQRYRNDLRRLERLARDEVEDIYHHSHIQRSEADLEILTDDLFGEATWLRLGLQGSQLAATGAVGGALIGGGIDASLGGSSFLLGALIGGVVGGMSGWMSGERLARVSIHGMRLGGKLLRIGPMRNAQFPWVALDRALLHQRLISTRAHARRDDVLVAPSDEASRGVVTGLPFGTRRALESAFSRLRRFQDVERRDPVRDELAGLIDPLLAAWDPED